MNNSALALLLAAAGTGLMSGTTVQTTPVPVRNGQTVSAGMGQTSMILAQNKDKHDCAGKNSCKGKGGCKTGDMGCKGKNSCTGKGGCNTM
jgi:hypothetical protein